MNEKINVAMETRNKVLEVMRAFNRPVTHGEIAEELDIPPILSRRIFDALLNNGQIVEYSSKSGRYKYYEIASKDDNISETISQKYVDMASALDKRYQEIKDENEELKNQVDKIYANIISLMGIFVAIFALIIINVDAINVFASKAEETSGLFWDLVVLNIPVTLAIWVLMIFIKKYILPKRKG